MTISNEDQAAQIEILSVRFKQHMSRHPKLEWEPIATKLRANPDKLWSLHEMEKTGGEPDVVGYDAVQKAFIFFDCAAESPAERRSCCYDQAALEARKKFKPKHSACELAKAMKLTLLSETQYKYLQELGDFDSKTSSWLLTPPKIRKLGGAIFADYRFEHVFVYHNGAESYYAGRGFRTCVYL